MIALSVTFVALTIAGLALIVIGFYVRAREEEHAKSEKAASIFDPATSTSSFIVRGGRFYGGGPADESFEILKGASTFKFREDEAK